MLSEPVAAPSGPWLHRFMVSCVTASIELRTLARPDLEFIAQHRILARAQTELRHPVPITDPSSGQTMQRDLIPDALFGLEYQTDTGSRFRFFVVECDRATEPATTSNFNRKSWLRSLLQYRAYIGGGLYQNHLQLTAPLLALNVVTDEQRLERLLAVTEAEQGSAADPYLLCQSIDAFGMVWRPQEPIVSLLEKPWRRPRAAEFKIDQA